MFGVVAVLLCSLLLSACKEDQNSPQNSANTIRIISGSENKDLEPMVQAFAQREGLKIEVTYKGSVDIMLEIEKGAASTYDAVWPADRTWITLGDRNKVIKNVESIYRTPVVFGVKKSVAQRLGWVGKPVSVSDILTAAKSGRFRYMMTSASQSNSGAAIYLGFLNAFAGKPEVLTMEDLAKPQVAENVRQLLGTVNRTVGSSGYLKDTFVQQSDLYDGMVNYETMVIAANQELARLGKEQLYVIYPTDGLSIADSPLGYISKGDAAKEQVFLKLQAYLKDGPQQDQMLATGHRTGSLGITVPNANPNVFQPAYGFDTTTNLPIINKPSAEVIREALVLYQTAFRKPSLTIYILDYSPSMNGTPLEQMKSGMRTVLDQDVARTYFLQTSPRDVTIAIPFDDGILGTQKVEGNNPEQLRAMSEWLTSLSTRSGTNFYNPLVMALPMIKQYDYENYNVAIVLMTDGESSGSVDQFNRDAQRLGLTGIPVYSIMFGSAQSSQLDVLAKGSAGKVFDGRKDLIGSFREVKGYNN
jgi:Ca-activated chloride channel family protein